MNEHPYRGLPRDKYWRTGVPLLPPTDLDPSSSPRFSLTRTDKVATLGSCFAQHVASALASSGYHYLCVEDPLEVTEPEPMFSARYGNVYTVRQALQLLERAFDGWTSADAEWKSDNGWVDAFRPSVALARCDSPEAVREERVQHLDAVRRVFLEADIMVFTLGLTEAWVSAMDGAVYPLAPGVVAGTFDARSYRFKNFNVHEVTADLLAWCRYVNELNPKCKIVLTVSPVPLAATYSDRHVLAATTYSKSVLRVAVEEALMTLPYVDYFASYEIITAPSIRGRYYAQDARTVTSTGVKHVMRTFFDRYSARTGDGDLRLKQTTLGTGVSREERVSRIWCDEESLDKP